MIPYYPDFFNDVFGPVMQPGSSSHTAGPCRLGYLANRLLRGPLQKIEIALDKNGSFAGTFGLMREDLGMLSGAFGLLPDDERLFDVKDLLRQAGVAFSFHFVDFPKDAHPNAVRFCLTDKNGAAVTLQGNSTGGGRVEVTEICSFPCRFLGDCFLTVCTPDSEPYLPDTWKQSGRVERLQAPDGRTALAISSDQKLPAFPGVTVLFRLPPVLPVAAGDCRQPQLFSCFTEWIAYAETQNINLAEAAIDYEKRASGLSKEDILSRMKELCSLMKKQTEAVYESEANLLEDPFSGYHFRDWRQYESTHTPLLGSVGALAMHYAFGVQAQQKGIKLVPGPMGTGGGYLFSAVRAVQESRGIGFDKMLEGLLVAAGVGAICYTRTNPTGEMLGCTGECGVCGAMAAAAVTHMCGGTPKQTEAAASLLLQMALGWPCDPIPGGKNQPCISRVMTAVVMAIACSDLALSGKDALLPFHEVVDVADKLGRAMPPALKCTSCGGLCETPTGIRCKQSYTNWLHTQDEAK